MGISAAELIDAAVTDSNPAEKSDHGVCFSYNGKVKVVPTKEELRLPSMKAVTFGENTQTSVNISWYTKLSVTGTDIEIYPANGNNPPMFTGTPTTGAGIRKFTQVVKRSIPQAASVSDFGSSEVETRRHVIQLTSLEKGRNTSTAWAAPEAGERNRLLHNEPEKATLLCRANPRQDQGSVRDFRQHR